MIPRRKKSAEIVNDHQVELVMALAEEGRIVPACETEDLPSAIAEAMKRQKEKGKGKNFNFFILTFALAL